jgi:hypothetical protein
MEPNMNSSAKRNPKSAILMTVALLLSVPAMAQAQTAGEDDWSAIFVLYLLGPTLDGTVGIGPVGGDVDMSAGDVFSALDRAFLGIYAGEGERWGVVADLVYMDLSEDDISGPAGILRGEVGNKQFTGLVSASYRVSEQTRLLAGFMYTDVTADIRISGPMNSRFAERSESWVDPVVGVLFNSPFGDRWDFSALAQVGGGVGADLAYGLTASLAWKFGKSTSLTFGYRYLYFDYEDGSGVGRFKFDMKQHGPALGFRFDL